MIDVVDDQATSRAPARRWLDAVAAASGALAVILLVVAGSLYTPSGAGANPTLSGRALVSTFARDIDAAPAAAVAYLLAAIAMLAFAGALFDHLRRGQATHWPAVLAAGGAIATAIELTEYARITLASVVVVDNGDAVTAGVMTTLSWEAARVLAVGSVAMMAGAGVAGMRGALPRWLTVLSLLGAGVVLAASVATALPDSVVGAAPAGLLALLGLLWTFPAAVVMARGSREGRPASAGASPRRSS